MATEVRKEMTKKNLEEDVMGAISALFWATGVCFGLYILGLETKEADIRSQQKKDERARLTKKFSYNTAVRVTDGPYKGATGRVIGYDPDGFCWCVRIQLPHHGLGEGQYFEFTQLQLLAK